MSDLAAIVRGALKPLIRNWKGRDKPLCNMTRDERQIASVVKAFEHAVQDGDMGKAAAIAAANPDIFNENFKPRI